jgi:hypothetical protein
MIRKTAAGYTVFARTGRKMGTYRTIDQAQVRLGQLEAFKAQRSPLGRMSPTVRAKSKEGRKGYYVRAKSGRSMGWYPTKAEALRRKGQLEANGAKFFKETRGFTRQGSPAVLTKRSARPGMHVRVTDGSGISSGRPGVIVDSRTHIHGLGEYERRLVREGWVLVQITSPTKYLTAIPANRLAPTSDHSWPGQPRRHTRQGSPTGESRVAQFQRRKLGERMAPWGSDFGYGAGPVGAVGSYYISGKAYPDRDMVLRALSIIVDDAHEADAGKHGWTKKDAAELRSIAGKLRHYLQHDYAQHSWPGQPRRHASAAKKGHRHHARRYRR